MTETAGNAGAAPAPPGLGRSVLIGWILAAIVLTLSCVSEILSQTYPDPDDAMRRLEVRDLIGGQSWWDVSQHRFVSGAMHWSRLVDLPLAAVTVPLRGLFGEPMAERVAMVVVPLVTLGCVMLLIAYLTRRLIDTEHAQLALLITPLTIPLIIQLRPMRIDHHGWQIALALAALYAFLTPRPTIRSGALGGLALGTLLTISLEGLPIAVCLLGLLAVRWAFQPERAAQLVAAASASFASAILFQALTRGPYFMAAACDAMAPVWLATLGVAALAIALATLTGKMPLSARFAALGAGGIACACTMALIDPRCLAGPFGQLDPLVHALWYEKVNEGLPIWEQTWTWALTAVGLPIIGLVGAVRALRAADGEARAAWWMMLSVQLATLLLALQVSRASATANAVAIPAGSLVVLALLRRARGVRRLAPRIAATAGALIVAAPGAAMVPLGTLALISDQAQLAAQAAHAKRIACTKMFDARALSALTPALLFAPVDIAPEIVASTDHRAIASGHHRNAAAMHDVILAFIGSPAQARRLIVERYHADYVVGCPGLNEVAIYETVAPNGFWARLERGERFDWLQPVPIAGSPVLAWRVLPSSTPRP